MSTVIDGDWKLGSIAGKKPTREELIRCTQALLTRQCIYPSSPGLGRTYELIRAYSSYFEAYFSCMGYRLVIAARDQMVALSVPQEQTRYDAAYQRLSKEQTIVLLALRLMWEEGVNNQDVQEGGIVETTTGDLIDRIKSVTQGTPLDERPLLDVLRFFQRYGVVRVGERDRIERVSPLSILPGVNVVVPDSFVEDLKLWLASPENRDQKPPAQQIEQPEKSVDVDIDTTSNLPDVDLSSFETEQ
jgi:hypothetical protein